MASAYVSLQVVLSSEAEPVGVRLSQPASQHLAGQLCREVVLSEALDSHKVAAVTFAKVGGLLPGVSDVEELIAVDAVKLPLS